MPRSSAPLVLLTALCFALTGCGEQRVDGSDGSDTHMADAGGDAGDRDATLPDVLVTDTQVADVIGDVDPDGGADATGNDATAEDTRIATDTADAVDTVDPPIPPMSVAPCADPEQCWQTLSVGGLCGTSGLSENFSSGRYGIHAFQLAVPGGVTVDVTLAATGGTWSPRLLLHDESGTTLWDGATGWTAPDLTVTGWADGSAAGLSILAEVDRNLTVFLTSDAVAAGGFVDKMPTDVTYDFTVDTDCEVGDGLLTPPNFDPNDVDAGGYHLLPDAQPSGLYQRKPDGCSRGNTLLIQVIYTVAVWFEAAYSNLTPILIRDLNEGPCSTVDHATHDDGTHVDIVAGCATSTSCTDIQPAVDLAKLFIDTGVVCGIIFDDAAVQAEVNPYFESKFSYEPWHGTFMRTVGGHTSHMHIRVMKPDGTCN